MPLAMLIGRFERAGRVVVVEVRGAWWPTPIFAREQCDDKAANAATYDALRAVLLAEGFRECED